MNFRRSGAVLAAAGLVALSTAVPALGAAAADGDDVRVTNRGEDGEGSRNVARAVGGLVVMAAAGGLFFLRRRFMA